MPRFRHCMARVSPRFTLARAVRAHGACEAAGQCLATPVCAPVARWWCATSPHQPTANPMLRRNFTPTTTVPHPLPVSRPYRLRVALRTGPYPSLASPYLFPLLSPVVRGVMVPWSPPSHHWPPCQAHSPIPLPALPVQVRPRSTHNAAHSDSPDHGPADPPRLCRCRPHDRP